MGGVSLIHARRNRGAAHLLLFRLSGGREERYRSRTPVQVLGFLAAVALLATTLLGQGAPPHVTGVAPAAGKVNDTVTVTGENLGKAGVANVFLSDDKTDYKATIVDQGPDKVVIKIPQVKAGDYNISVQAGNSIFIQPVRLKVQE